MYKLHRNHGRDLDDTMFCIYAYSQQHTTEHNNTIFLNIVYLFHALSATHTGTHAECYFLFIFCCRFDEVNGVLVTGGKTNICVRTTSVS